MANDKRRIRNDANTTYNVISIAGESLRYEHVIQSDKPLTPGCAVVPYIGAPTETAGYDGSHGAVTAPTAPTEEITGKMGVRVIDIGGTSGLSITDEFKAGDQVPTLSNQSGAHWNVRIASDETVEEGQLLTVTTDGSGLFTAVDATLENAEGIAREALVVKNPDWPAYIRMEVL